jgi:magnesium-transporting ATPase (P-type)
LAFAIEGLRTLVMGKRAMTSSEYLEFELTLQSLKTSTDKDKDAHLLEYYDSLEQGLTFVGSSAIEDKL